MSLGLSPDPSVRPRASGLVSLCLGFAHVEGRDKSRVGERVKRHTGAFYVGSPDQSGLS